MKLESKINSYKVNPYIDLLGSFLGLFGFLLFIFLYSRNEYSLNNLILSIEVQNIESIMTNLYDIFNTYFNDLSSFVIQSSKYIINNGYSLDNAFYIYKEFALNFSNIIALAVMYSGLYLRTKGSAARRIITISSNSILIITTAFLLSIAI